MFIKKLTIQSDCQTVLGELSQILTNTQWLPQNQIGLTHRTGAELPWKDATGSIYNRVDKKRIARESDFSVWHPALENSYVKSQVLLLAETMKFNIGRVRFMRLLPKTGLSVHLDFESRYHLVLRTNKKSFICHNVADSNPERSDVVTSAVCYHLPQDNTWYHVDTRETHWVYNGGDNERIHLVVCEA